MNGDQTWDIGQQLKPCAIRNPINLCGHRWSIDVFTFYCEDIVSLRKKLNQLKVWLHLVITALFVIAYLLTDVSTDLQPTNLVSATRLALTIARRANCGDFEYYDSQKSYSVFTCQMVVNAKDAMFAIYIFYDEASKNRMAIDFRSKDEWGLYKIGSFYIISEFTYLGKEKTEQERIKTAQDYANFPGLIVMPLSR